MKHSLAAAAAAVLVALVASAPGAQEPQRAPGTLTEGVTAVLVDVVVRDRRNQPVRDLSASEFEVLEDGVPQSIASFTPVFGTPPPAAAEPRASRADAPGAPGAPPPAGGADRPLVTALVFDRLTPEGRQLAVEAAQSYLGNRERAPHHIGVFGIDLSLASFAPFTRNAVVLREALARVATRGSSAFNSPEGRERLAGAERRAGSVGDVSAVAPPGPDGAQAGATAAAAGVDALLAQMEAQALRDFEAMERDQQGYATTNALFAVVNSLAELPGRKSLVLFSEGVAVPPAVQRAFLGVIDAANRANVSIYTIDAAGLRAESEQAKIRDQVNRTARRGIDTGYSADAAGGPLTRALEWNEDVLRQDPEGSLGRLAQATGGLLFNNTNNLRQGLARIDEDLRNYYLLGYTPTNDTLDGSFRTIEVKVNRPGVTVAARRGYFAVPDSAGAVNPWEAPALGALEQKPVPNAFPVRAGALLFPERGRPGLTPVLVEFRTDALTFAPAEDGQTYTSDFAVLVRFLDAQNRVARRIGQHYELQGPLDQIDNARRGEVVFYREPELPPGTYIMEAVVYDALSDKASVRFATVEVAQVPDHRLRMSSIVLVKGGEALQEAERRADNPLLVNDVALRPNLGDPVSKAAKEVAFYFAVYPAPGGPTPEAAIELLHNGTRLARVPMLVAPPDATGRSQQVGRLPLDQLSPGTYELAATVRQGDEQVSQSTMLRLTE